jgi:hypothetical protein
VPILGWAVIRFRADNPGAWIMHCHMEWHLQAGLALVMNVMPAQAALLGVPAENVALCPLETLPPALRPQPRKSEALSPMGIGLVAGLGGLAVVAIVGGLVVRQRKRRAAELGLARLKEEVATTAA